MTRRAWGYLEGSVSIVLNTALFAAKLWLGAACGSLAIVADAWHTLSDSLTSAVVILGFWVSGRPADDKHPFGHGRAELVAAIVIGTLLAVVAFFFLHESILKLRHPERYPAARFGTAAAALFLVSVVVKEAMARFSIWAGGKTASAALVADGWHHRSDAVASALILAGGLFGGRLGWIDGAMGAAVSFSSATPRTTCSGPPPASPWARRLPPTSSAASWRSSPTPRPRSPTRTTSTHTPTGTTSS